MSRQEPISIPYKEGRKVFLDKESTFIIAEYLLAEGKENLLTTYNQSRTAHNQLMNMLSIGPFKVKKRSERIEVSYDSLLGNLMQKADKKQGFSFIPAGKLEETVEFLSVGNNISKRSARYALSLADGNYELASELLEEAVIGSKEYENLSERSLPIPVYPSKFGLLGSPEDINNNVFNGGNPQECFSQYDLQEHI